MAVMTVTSPSRAHSTPQNVLRTNKMSVSQHTLTLSEFTTTKFGRIDAAAVGGARKNAVTPCRWSPKPTVTHVNNVNNKDSFEQ